MSKGHYQWVAKHYDQLSNNGPFSTLAPKNKGGHKARYIGQVFDTALMEHITHLERTTLALDVGCGTGIFTSHLAPLCDAVVGVDVSQKMLRIARQECAEWEHVVLAQTDGIQLPLPDMCVDLVVAREALCYCPDESLAQTLQAIFACVNSGGTFYWLEQISNEAAWRQRPEAPNMTRRSREELIAVAQKAGWQLTLDKVVRKPRFPWIYPVWLGLVPKRFVGTLANLEVRINSHALKPTHRWHDHLFVFNKSA